MKSRNMVFLVWVLSAIFGVFASTFASGDLAEGIRYNEVRQISSHNSYDIDGIKPDLKDQADQGVRSFEFDMHKSSFLPPWLGGRGNYPHSDWGIYHTTDIQSGGEHCQTLSGCLTQLKEWHDQRPDHEVITLWLQMGRKLDGAEDMWETGGHFPVDLDKGRLEKDLPGMIFTPVQLLRRCPQATNLQGAVKLCGWPTLSELKGKFLVVLQGDNQAAQDYLHHVNSYRGDRNVGNEGYQGNKVSFVAFDINNCDGINNQPNTVFFNMDKQNGGTAECVYENKFVSRVYKINDSTEWNDARNWHVHHLATDHVTNGIFEPRAVSSSGKPFELMGESSSPVVVVPQILSPEVVNPTVPVGPVVINEVRVHVHTNDDNKDWNTGVEFQAFSLGGTLIAETGVMRGEEYQDGSDKYFTLNMKNPLTKLDLESGGKLRICIDPRGGFRRDTWKFNTQIIVTYSDGSQTTRSWRGGELSQNNKEGYLNWIGM